MKSNNNYRSSRHGYTGTYERNTRTSDSNFQNRYDANDRNTYGNRFPEDSQGYSDAPSYSEDRERGYNAYNSDTRRDSDAYNYRSSGGYGREKNDDRSGSYDRNSQSYNDCYNLDQPGKWSEDRTRRTSPTGSYRSSENRYRHEDRWDDSDNQGYAGRNSSDYNSSSYGDRYYDPSDNYRRRDERGYTYRHDEDYERESRRTENPGRYSWGRTDEDRSKGDYGYYESYPSYGQSESYGDHERYSGKTGGQSRTDSYGERDYDYNYNRPSIKNRRFW